MKDTIYEIQKEDGTIGYWTDYQIKQHMSISGISSKAYMIQKYYGKVLRKKTVSFLVAPRKTDYERMQELESKFSIKSIIKGSNETIL